MPLPNADKDKRLYALLKTQDLENLSYADFQAAAESVFVEGVNEDDLRRIVLIQLARTAVAGEWSGFTSAGGGGAVDFGFGAVMGSGQDLHVPGEGAPYGGTAQSASTVGSNQQMCWPFVSPISATINKISVRVNSGATNILKVGIYNASGDGYPTTQIGGEAQINCSSSGYPEASPASSIPLVKGTKYWIVYCWTSNYAGAGASPAMWIHTSGMPTGFQNTLGQGGKMNMQTTTGTSNVLPSTMPNSDYTNNFNKKIKFGITYL